MLAITHHIIVKIAAITSGIKSFCDYAVLGDDIVIRNSTVAEAYLNIMKQLGVSINLSKSVISNDFAEFAKTYRGPNLNFTPIGAGLILQTVRYPAYVSMLLTNLYQIAFFTTIGDVVKLLRKPISFKRYNVFLGL